VALPEDREVRLRCYRNALRNWLYDGYIVPKKRVEEWLRQELPEFLWRDIRAELFRYVEAGGEIDEQAETRPEFVHYEFHFDLRVEIGGRRLYFETVLEIRKDPDDPDDPMIVVVNVHDV
jgi:hypothetical protein